MSFDETTAVRETICAYVEGTYNADIDILRPLFHVHATLAGDLPGQRLYGNADDFFAHLKSRPSMKDNGDAYDSQIDYIDVTSNIASVTLRETNFFGELDFVNYLSLIKDGHRWKIIAKTFSGQPAS